MQDIITVERQTTTRDDFGGETLSWITFWKGRAWVRYGNGSQRNMNGEVTAQVTKKIVVRNRPAFTLDMRILLDGNHYRILSLDNNRQDMSTTFIVELINE